MEHDEDREVTLDARAIPHVPGALAFGERAGIENVGRVRQPSTLDPRGIDNVDRESSQTRSDRGLLVQLETNGLGKLPLLLVEAVEVVRRQFERRCYVQDICGAGAQLGSRLAGQLARPFKYLFQ
jgi:hypothetical protein